MNGVLLWIAGVIVTLLAALFAVPYAVDWNSYRGVFEEEASRMLGREVRVGGNVNLRLLPAPYVSFERPRIADEEIGDAFFRAESFTMWLALPPLVQGIIEAKQVELKQPVLRLQVNPDGGGNWSSFRLHKAALPFAPREVSLQSVRITDGVLALHGTDGEALARIEIADGELSAPALEGPYKLRADVRWNGEVREVRASTAPADQDGSTRVKLTVRAPDSGNSYSFDGRVSDLFGQPNFNGTLTAVIPVNSRPFRPTIHAETGTVAPHGAFEVRAAVSASAIDAKLSDISFSFEQNGQPQLLTGTAEASWHSSPVVKATLSSRWLDLDRIADVPAEADALEALRRLTDSFTDFLPTNAEVAARITVDQANLAGDMVSGVVVAIENTGQGLKIKELRASLPGGSRIDVSGSLTGAGTAEAFSGDVLLRGANLGRFLAWAGRGSRIAEAKSDSGFSVSTRLDLGNGRIELRNASLDTGSNRVSGDFAYQWVGRRQLSVSIETAHADLSNVLPGALGPELLTAKLASLVGKSGSSSVGMLAETDTRIRIRADVLTDGTRVLHDVDADIAIENASLRIPSLKASTPEGFTLDLEGEVSDIAGRANGALRGVIAASAPTALAGGLAIAAADIDPAKSEWLAALAPLRLAFVSRFGRKSESAAEISVDGVVHGKPLVGTLVLDGGLGNWRTGPLDLMITSESPEVARIARGLLFGGAKNAEEITNSQSGRFLLKAAGTAQDAAVLLQIAADELQLDLRGRGALPEGQHPTFDGEMEISAADANRAFRFAGLELPVQAALGKLAGKADVTLDGKGLTLALSELELDDAQLTGEARLTGPEGARKLELDLKSDRVSLPGLVALMLDGSDAGLPLPAASDVLEWSDKPFDFSNLAHVNGRFSLQADILVLGQGFTLSDAVLEAELEPERISITKLEGKAIGGAVSGAFKLEKTTAGAELSGALGLWDIHLNRITGASNAPVGAGRLQLTLQVRGQAVTPRALATVLTGTGELELKSARWERLSPNAIEATTNAVLTGRTQATSESLQQALRAALAAAPLNLGNLRIPVDVGEGAIKIKDFKIEAPQATVTNRTTIDIAELKIDSEWRFEPKPAKDGASRLPGMSVIYVGPLSSLGSLEPRLVMDALERELAVRGMERDVEHLERLRKEDEARARAEAERLKALELEQLWGAEAQPPTIDVPFPFPSRSNAPQQQHLTIEPSRPERPSPTWPTYRIEREPMERSGT